jgi:deoxyhypusine monooxygenase
MSVFNEKEEASKCITTLENVTESITAKIRCLWNIRSFQDKELAIQVLSTGFVNKSVLLRHELAYVMGQIGHETAIPILENLLGDPMEDCMVRHEAGESLGAIGTERTLDILKKYRDDSVREVAETCILAIEKIEKNQRGDCVSGEFVSVDPVPPFKNKPTLELSEILLNPENSLYIRYRAMFALRNNAQNGDLVALNALCSSFTKQEGALFKHEVAFVLGQLQKLESVETLIRVLKDESEHEMVRHEASEALGNISDPKTIELLQEYQKDKHEPVSESCIVAVDIYNYWKDFEKSK